MQLLFGKLVLLWPSLSTYRIYNGRWILASATRPGRLNKRNSCCVKCDQHNGSAALRKPEKHFFVVAAVHQLYGIQTTPGKQKM